MKNKATMQISGISFSVLIIASVLLFSSCSKGPHVPKEWELLQNSFYGFELQHPKDWYQSVEPKYTKFYPTQEMAAMFYEFYTQGKPPKVGDAGDAVEFVFGYDSFKEFGSSSLEEYRDSAKSNFLATNFEISGVQPCSFGKENGVEIDYKAKISEKSMFFGKRLIVAHDSVFYYVDLSAFNEYFDAYKASFDTLLASIKLPKPKVAKTGDDISKPSADFTTFDNQDVSLQHPDNFEPSYPAKKGDMLSSVKFMGYRQDCTMQIDILPAKKLTVDKVFDQNKGKFNPKSTGDTKVDGNAAKFLTYTPVAKIEGKAIFVVKNDKVYRILLTWYQPMSADYSPVFEKMIASLKIK